MMVPFLQRTQSACARIAANSIVVVIVLLALCVEGSVRAAENGAGNTAAVPSPRFFLRECRVLGVTELPTREVEDVVYPYLGPGRTAEDLESARSAVEKLYQEKGCQAASVQIAAQPNRRGIVYLQVNEGRVANLRVKGARYFLPSDIKRRAGSVQEGRVLNFDDVDKDIVALNKWGDLRVTPKVSAGAEPGTVDVDLVVEDTFPLHGGVELNNRRSADTSSLRLDANLSYNNLWQAGHSIGASWETSPEDTSEVKVYSGYYIARFAGHPGFTLEALATKQDSAVSTLGSTAVAGRGQTVGLLASFALPGLSGFDHSLSLGVDYKHYIDTVTAAGEMTDTPITYFPITLGYGATRVDHLGTTALNANVVFGIRGVGSRSAAFDYSRAYADGNFIYLRGDLSRTQKLPKDFELFGKVQGQIAGQPLVSSEQISGGGLGTVRGYLEAEVIADSGIFGSLELRSPQLLGWLPWKGAELQLYLFAEGGHLSLRDPLPEQDASFDLASIGAGGRVDLLDHLYGAFDLGLPLIDQVQTQAGNSRLSFRLGAEF